MEINDTDHVAGVAYDLTYQGERSLYRLPGDRNRLQLLIRSWKPGSRGFLWTASCTMGVHSSRGARVGGKEQESTDADAMVGWCAPGTGANMLQVLDGDAAVGIGNIASGARNCDWSEVRETDIPDANARTCAAALPADFLDPRTGRHGGVWMIANSAESRLTLVFSTSSDGLEFDRHWVIRDRTTALPLRFEGHGKSPGFQYPAGMWRNGTMLIVYSEGKENISTTIFRLESLQTRVHAQQQQLRVDPIRGNDTQNNAACPCSSSTLCRSLSPQPAGRPEVLAFHVPGFYTNPTTEHEPEPYYFHHYPWGNVTTVAAFVGSEGRPGSEPANWDTSSYTPELVCTAHQHDARIVAHIGCGGHMPQVVNASWRRKWVGDIVDWFIIQHGFDGVQFDV
eukprot:SAG31_NODE_1331_length_8748_cov_5.583189_8_plen_396_part_00